MDDQFCSETDGETLGEPYETGDPPWSESPMDGLGLSSGRRSLEGGDAGDVEENHCVHRVSLRKIPSGKLT